jgi:hypothetical protein
MLPSNTLGANGCHGWTLARIPRNGTIDLEELAANAEPGTTRPTDNKQAAVSTQTAADASQGSLTFPGALAN